MQRSRVGVWPSAIRADDHPDGLLFEYVFQLNHWNSYKLRPFSLNSDASRAYAASRLLYLNLLHTNRAVLCSATSQCQRSSKGAQVARACVTYIWAPIPSHPLPYDRMFIIGMRGKLLKRRPHELHAPCLYLLPNSSIESNHAKTRHTLRRKYRHHFKHTPYGNYSQCFICHDASHQCSCTKLRRSPQRPGAPHTKHK